MPPLPITSRLVTLQQRGVFALRSIRACNTSSFFPHVGRLQQTEGVRKFVTRRYAYLIYYTVDDAADEIIVLSVKHSAQRREHDDA